MPRTVPIRRLDLDVPCPWSAEELRARVDQACRFIDQAKKHHARQLGWEVGEHLYVSLYDSDHAYIRSRSPDKPDSLRDVAGQVQIPHMTLRTYLEAAMMRRTLEEGGFVTPRPLHFYRNLYPLFDEARAAVALARWATERRIPVWKLRSLALALVAHIDGGGKIEDFLRKKKRTLPGPAPRRRQQATSDDLLTERIAIMACRWNEKCSISPALKRRLRARAVALRARIAAGDPGPSPRPTPVPPVFVAPGPLAPPPFTEDERKKRVQKAVSFIRKRLREHRFQFALEVGGHLMQSIFKGDRNLYHRGGTWKTTTIQDIATDPRVQIPAKLLYASIHLHLLVEQYGRQAPGVEVPAFSIYKWDALFVPLENDPTSLKEVADWIQRDAVPRHLVIALARILRPYLAMGGELDDLMPLAEGRGPDSPYRRIGRMLDIAWRWLDGHPLPDHVVGRTLEALDRLIASL